MRLRRGDRWRSDISTGQLGVGEASVEDFSLSRIEAVHEEGDGGATVHVPEQDELLVGVLEGDVPHVLVIQIERRPRGHSLACRGK